MSIIAAFPVLIGVSTRLDAAEIPGRAQEQIQWGVWGGWKADLMNYLWCKKALIPKSFIIIQEKQGRCQSNFNSSKLQIMAFDIWNDRWRRGWDQCRTLSWPPPRSVNKITGPSARITIKGAGYGKINYPQCLVEACKLNGPQLTFKLVLCKASV